MDDERFWYICNSQRKWAEEFSKHRTRRAEARKIINRKQVGKGGAELKANILNDLRNSLFKDEITITKNLEGDGFDVVWLGEHHSLPPLSKFD